MKTFMHLGQGNSNKAMLFGFCISDTPEVEEQDIKSITDFIRRAKKRSRIFEEWVL